MKLGVFIPTGNNGWIPSTTSPQYQPTYELNRSVVERAEAMGFDFALCMVKFRGFGGQIKFWDTTLETFTLMSALAPVTERIKLYCSVAVLTLHPAVVARMAATIDDIAPGRFGINIVSGWNRSEYSQMGLWPGDDYFQRRYDYAGEYVSIMRELWETGQSDHRGDFFTLEDCRLGPTPAHHIDIVAAGSSPRGRRFAAEYADFNFTDAAGPDGLRTANEELAAAAAVTGRSVSSIVLRQLVLDDTDAGARAKVEHYNAGTDRVAAGNMAGNYQVDSTGTSSQAAAEQLLAANAASLTNGLIAGSPATVAATLNELAAVEGTGGILVSFDDYREGLDRFRDVVPLLDFELAGAPQPATA
ncbi:LLM class flavin-dependent oxidoreductase [Nakamurella leprariae]|uniref:LLM class flavin-dependent oxidoreductase n=1 Tax=Nakamurella leprariae TaxID=2803911 RepID=A0A939BXD5_9ACTN|nr:LLM class flavin-dependent oxidoreductase [Nakamurella leprariae]MBM9465865.1 LLM class flavin-dependent oxidoreductase [Nakamurella leprariae]